jgi:hypothetical protein
MIENAENTTNAEQVAPAPATAETSAEVTAPVIEKPTDSPVEKSVAAHIAQRKEIRELKKQLAEAKATVPPVPAEAKAPEQAKPEPIITSQAPAPTIAENSIEEESVKAIQFLAKDKAVASVPGGIMEIIALVDTDPRLVRLHNIDPKMAFEEGRKLWAEKLGITAPVPHAKPSTISGGMGGSNQDLEAMIRECEKLAPGSREHSKKVSEINAEMKRQNIL